MSRVHLPGKLLCLCALLLATPAAAADFMFQATVDGETIEGRPLAWTADIMHLLGRDGQLFEFNPQDAKNAVKTSPKYVPYSMQEIKRELYREFGDDMSVTTTKHYIVVHPRGGTSDWANRFEELYRWCLSYFKVRGFQPREPAFPLVAVVYPNKAEYHRAAVERGSPIPNGVVGIYDTLSNRVYLYDSTDGKPGEDWSENASTIIHEATHQTAFNVGIHSRYTMPPRWLGEGLATMFEARGVWNAQSFHSIKDRLNKGRIDDFRTLLSTRSPGNMMALVASDKPFQYSPGRAYAEAWALAFFLCETRPREFVAYLEKTAARPSFQDYTAQQRVMDFAECFGSDFKQLEANFLNWMAQIRD